MSKGRMMRVVDDMDGYRSSEDEDYDPGAAGAKGKRKSLAGFQPRSAPKLGSQAKKPRLGQAVVSDDDDDDGWPSEPPAPRVPDVAARPAGAQSQPAIPARATRPQVPEDTFAGPSPLESADSVADATGGTRREEPGAGSAAAAAEVGRTEPPPAEAQGPRKPAPRSSPLDSFWEEMKAEGMTVAVASAASEGSSLGPASSHADGKPGTVCVTKVVEYAGEKLEVVADVVRGSREERRLKDARVLASGTSNLAGLLSEFGRRETISTIDKSRLDWKRDKDEVGDADELSQFHKDGFVEKQQFLAEVDLRRFEIELAERNRLRDMQKRQAATKSRLGSGPS